MKFKMFIILVMVLTATSNSWGAAFTSKAAGNWSAAGQTTWNEEGVPGDGDTWTLDHAVTVDTDTVTGTSPADITTMIGTINQNGRLIIATGINFTAKGNIYNNAGASGSPQNGIQLGAGSHLHFDNTTANVLKGGGYSRIYARGTSGAPAVISSVNTGYAYMTQALSQKGNCFDAQWLDMSNLGNDTNVAIKSSSGGAGSPLTTSLTDVTITNSGELLFEAATAAGSVVWNRVKQLSPTETGTLGAYFLGYAGSVSTINDSIIMSESTFNPPAGFTVTNTYFHKKVGHSNVTLAANYPTLFQYNVIRSHATGARDFFGDMDSSYLIEDGASANPSMINFKNTKANQNFTNSIVESTGVAVTGDFILPWTTDYLLTVSGNIFTPNSAGLAPGKFVSNVYETATSTTAITKNTIAVGLGANTTPETGIGVGENDVGHVDEISAIKSNLFFAAPSATANRFKLVRQQSAKQDFVSSANMDYNWGWNLDAGSETAGVNAWAAYRATTVFSSGVADVHGSTGDPQFTDWTRNVATFDTAATGLNNAAGTAWADTHDYVVGDVISSSTATFYGGATINFRCITAHTSVAGNAATGQPTAAITTGWRANWEFMSLYRLREDTSRIATMLAWVKAGYTPLNPATATAGEGGTYVGAVAVQSQSSTPARRKPWIQLWRGLQ